MSSAVRYEAEIGSTRRQPSDAKQAKYLKSDSARILNKVFRVRLDKVLKTLINCKFKVIFDRCQVRYITGKVYIPTSLSRLCISGNEHEKNIFGLLNSK
jgi:hypothetical protein